MRCSLAFDDLPNTLQPPDICSAIILFTMGRRCLQVPRHVLSSCAFRGAGLNDFQATAGASWGNIWHNIFFWSGFSLLLLDCLLHIVNGAG